MDLLAQAHATGLPTLMKDFILDPQQIAAAAHAGASAVLLIERAFHDPHEREALVAAAQARGLEVLLEVHSGPEWMRAQASAADLIGVNARDLDTLTVDVEAAHQLVARIAPHRPVVALSGVASPADARRAFASGALACLVGTHLLRSRDPAVALRALQRPLAKVCGITNATDLDAAGRAGADLVGFIVGSPDSPRNLTPMAAQALVQQAKGRGARTVLVTRGTQENLVVDWCGLVRPDYLQVHGITATAAFRHRLAACGVGLLAAVPPGTPLPEDADGVVVDATPQGGSGRPHAWDPVPPSRLALVAGGLHAGNAAQAIQASGAWGADASSQLESSPGRKDPAKVRAFVQAVHAA